MLISTVVTPSLLEQATEMARTVPRLRLSQTEGRYNIAAALSELAAAQFLKIPIEGNLQFDLHYKGKRVDVKSATSNVVPNYTYNGCIPVVNSHQETDYYLFTRVLRRNEKLTAVYLMAYMRRDGYYAKAHFLRAGASHGGMVAKFDTYSLEYRRMLDPKRMLRDDWPACDSMQLMLTEARNTARALVDPTPSADRDKAVNTVKSWICANK